MTGDPSAHDFDFMTALRQRAPKEPLRETP